MLGRDLLARLWRQLLDGDSVSLGSAAADAEIERPWRMSWRSVPKRSAGAGFTAQDYSRARERAIEVARSTMGDHLWSRLLRDGHLDVPSRLYDGLTYRIRIGRRIELVWSSEEAEARSPWPYRFLCINPVYPLPAAEFAAQLYLYVRDREDLVVRLAAPQPYDQVLGRTF
jgi:hypothetical protein